VAENPKYTRGDSRGAKGIGEPAICAINAAIGDDFLRRTPATPSKIVASLDAGKRVDEGLVTHV
jgi:CO/xanthine dehydrogenase Mo-binding subunit